MLIRRRRGWELPEREATDEAVFHDRRRVVQGIAAGTILAAGVSLGAASSWAAAEADPSGSLYPAKRNDKFVLDRPLTDEKASTTYNNFYEFGTDKSIWREAQHRQVDLARGAGAEGAAVDDQDRRHGRWRCRGPVSR